MALIPGFFLDCVVAIGVRIQNHISWIGTGFIVGIDKNEFGKTKHYTFLVTNKHILNNKTHILLRFNYAEELKSKDYLIEFNSKEEKGKFSWVGHDDKNIDIAVLKIDERIFEGEAAKLVYFHLDEHAMSVSDMLKEGVSEGDSVFFLGFPMGLVSDVKKYNHVVSRSASIARIRDVFNLERKDFIIDGNIMPGNSGGPVITRPELTAIPGTIPLNRSALIGVIKIYISYTDVAVSRQTGRERVRFEENSGLAVVETVDSIRSAIDAFFRLN